jgi:TonB family protein
MKILFLISICSGLTLLLGACKSTPDGISADHSAKTGEQQLSEILDTMNASNMNMAMVNGDAEDIICFLDKQEEQGAVYGKYFGKVQKHASKNWNIEGSFSEQKLSVTIEALVDRQGVVASRKIKTSSGNARFDSLALEAFDRIPRFPKFPQTVTEERLPLILEYIHE